jgi:hypothetical protein
MAATGLLGRLCFGQRVWTWGLYCLPWSYQNTSGRFCALPCNRAHRLLVRTAHCCLLVRAVARLRFLACSQRSLESNPYILHIIRLVSEWRKVRAHAALCVAWHSNISSPLVRIFLAPKEVV